MRTIALPDVIPVQDVSSFYKHPGISVHVLRADQVHPTISGNKWFKLYYYVRAALQQNKKGLFTFGGAWSNHIAATAAAGAAFGLCTHGIIRGEEPAVYSATLQQAVTWGMKLQFISRSEYRRKEKIIPPDEYLLVPEGGYGTAGMVGASHLLNYLPGYTHYCCACGTGTTLAGLLYAAKSTQRVTGISVLKNNYSLTNDVTALLPAAPAAGLDIQHDYHFGGYARYNEQLISFMNDFFAHTNIPSDFVYTGKLFFAIHQLLQKNYFPEGSRIVLIHTGGLQGNQSLPKGTLMF